MLAPLAAPGGLAYSAMSPARAGAPRPATRGCWAGKPGSLVAIDSGHGAAGLAPPGDRVLSDGQTRNGQGP